ncbi:MAG: hypothetical protein ACOWYE_04975 [Desulfatiglandales bacterium]
MKDKETLHKKVQEMIDCFATTDPLKEMSELDREGDVGEAALKWLALTTLHGINRNTEKITIQKSADGEVRVTAQYRPAQLPSPGLSIGEKIIETIRRIIHLEEEWGETSLALGVREGSIEVKVEVERFEGGEKVTIKFPQ